MHYKIAVHLVLKKQKTRDCKGKLRQIERTICKPKNGGRNHQKELEDLIVANSQDTHLVFDIKDEPGMDSGLGHDEELDGMGLDDLVDDLLPNEVTIPMNSLNVQQNLNTMAEFLMKIDEDVASNVDFPDFMICFNGEQKPIVGYRFPLSLVPTVERIIHIHGDVSASSSVKNSNIKRKIYLFLCATIKEMEDLKLHEVSEKKMLIWRDAIKDALQINFKVEFAMCHLKKIARAYFGRIGAQLLQAIGDKMDALHEVRAEAFEGFKDCLADAMDFHGQPVSTGLFP